MAAKKLVRDLVLLGHPLRLHLCSQPQASCWRLRLITAGGHPCNRRYGVFNEFSKKDKGEVSRTRFFSSSPEVSSTFQKLKEVKVVDLAKQGYDMVRDELTGSPSNTKIMYHAKWDASKDKYFVDNVRERWEASDNPVLHEIEDLNETIFQETETTAPMREICWQDPYFSLPKFVAEVKDVVKPVLSAYIKGDVETLKKYCSSELIERCKAEYGAYKTRGIFFDNKILHVGDVGVRETKMLGTSPIMIVSFLTHQIYCVRDQNGAITEGGEEAMYAVYYDWAMQQVNPEELGEDAINPIWRLRAMRQNGVRAL